MNNNLDNNPNGKRPDNRVVEVMSKSTFERKLIRENSVLVL